MKNFSLTLKRINFRRLVLLFVIAVVSLIFSFALVANAGPYDYTPLAPIPGTGSGGSDLVSFIESIYQFGIWTVGIAALLMITIGGFMYMVSAGNTAKMDVAKKVVTDALWGLIIALTAYLILYVINPDLVKISIQLKPISSITVPSSVPGVPAGVSPSGNCQPTNSGPCSIANMTGKCNWDPQKASAICLKESSGKEDKKSKTDKCTDGESFSIGLFQINLTCQCKNAFDPKLQNGCANYKCFVRDPNLYKKCVDDYSIAGNNIRKACEIYQIKGWDSWGANTNSKDGCHFSS